MGRSDTRVSSTRKTYRKTSSGSGRTRKPATGSSAGSRKKNTVKTARKKTTTTSKNQRKKSPKKTAAKRKTTKARSKSKETIKKGVRRALLDFYTISLIFLGLLILSSMFLVYQWKDFWITEYGKDIGRLQGQIFTLTSELSHNQATVNHLQQQVEKVAPKKLGLQPSLKEPIVFKVNQNKLEYYVRKDQGKE